MDAFPELRQDSARLTLDPDHGGAVRSFEVRGRQVLRPTPANLGSDPFDLACFPMVPYCNRIANGMFRFAGRLVQLPRNWDADPHPLHGQGWRAPWALTRQTACSATLRFDGGGDDWPWPYRAEQVFTVYADGLEIELSAENRGPDPMPVMLGLHPYFNVADEARLQGRLPRVWRTGDDALPQVQMDTPAAWRCDTPRPVAAVPLDHCFSGWDGRMTFSWPDFSVTMEADPCQHLHLYVPVERDFWCAEPQTAAAGALGRGVTPEQIVPAGGRASLRMRLTVEFN